jgi:hypothetical protein
LNIIPDTVSTITNLPLTMWRDLIIPVGELTVFGGSGVHPYMEYMNHLLSYSAVASDSGFFDIFNISKYKYLKFISRSAKVFGTLDQGQRLVTFFSK